ncbi:hypothetical protein VTO42DRAFT_7144 [Malbranchea cinnamomea]
MKFIAIVKDCDNFPYPEPGDTEAYDKALASLWKFFLPHDTRPHGFLLDHVVQTIPWTNDFKLVPAPRREVHLLQGCGENWQEDCNHAIDRLLDVVREQNIFPELGKKRNEKFPIVGAKFPIGIERSASALFGIIGLGVHMTVYTLTKSGFKFWIPQRNLNKATYPGMLDNAVAGGVAGGETPFECLVREASEEAGIPEEQVRRDARAAGTVTWFNISDKRAGGMPGLMNPGVLYVYDLEVSQDVQFKPVDGDIHAFHLMSVQEVKDALANGRFKPASANVMIDFLIRHGIFTAEDDADYAEIVSRLHRKLPLPTSPHQ